MLVSLLLLLQSHARERKDIMAVSTLDELRDWLDEQSVRLKQLYIQTSNQSFVSIMASLGKQWLSRALVCCMFTIDSMLVS